MKIALYAIAGLVIVQAITYFIFVKSEHKKWSQMLVKLFRILFAGAIAYFWVWMALSDDPSSSILVRVVGCFAGLFIIYYIYNKVAKDNLHTK